MESLFKSYRFLTLLISLLVFIIIYPVMRDSGVGIKLISFFLTAVLIAGVYAVAVRKQQLIVGTLLACCALAASWTNHFVAGPIAFTLNYSFNLIFVGYVLVIIFIYVIKSKKITANTIIASLCVYLLLCLFWTFIYVLIELVSPGAFSLLGGEQGLVGSSSEIASHKFPALFYYSIVTITTLGYGDITPMTNLARSISALEAVFGQIYLTVLVARLVGLHINQSNSK